MEIMKQYLVFTSVSIISATLVEQPHKDSNISCSIIYAFVFLFILNNSKYFSPQHCMCTTVLLFTIYINRTMNIEVLCSFTNF